MKLLINFSLYVCKWQTRSLKKTTKTWKRIQQLHTQFQVLFRFIFQILYLKRKWVSRSLAMLALLELNCVHKWRINVTASIPIRVWLNPRQKSLDPRLHTRLSRASLNRGLCRLVSNKKQEKQCLVRTKYEHNMVSFETTFIDLFKLCLLCGSVFSQFIRSHHTF